MKNVKTVIRMFQQVQYILNSQQRRKCIMIYFIIIGGAFFEMLGISAIFPFIQSMVNVDAISSKWYIQILTQTFHIADTNALLVLLGSMVVLIYLIKNVYLFLSKVIQTRFRTDFFKELSVRMLKAFLNRPYSYFVETNSSIIIRDIQNDTNRVYDILDTMFQFSAELLTIFLIGVYILYTDLIMALGVMLLASICVVIILVCFKSRISYYGDKQRESNAMQYKSLYQAINGIKEIKVFNRKNHFLMKYEKASEDARRSSLGYGVISAVPERLIETFSVGALMTVVCIRISLGVELQTFVPNLAVFAVAAFRILPSISKMTGYITTMVFYRPALEESYENVKEFNRYEIEHSKSEKNEKMIDSDNSIGFEKQIAVQNLDWKYTEHSGYILKGLNLTIEKGQSVAFIGASGSGKTTLADIILGLYVPQKGDIQMDSLSIYDIREKWSHIIGYIPQDVFVLDDSIRANILFGLPEGDNDDKVWSALEQAQLKEFVKNLPEQLDTILGERGVKFSGGQRQRIAIARALYNDPDILLMDEATSALDNDTENAVMKAVETLHGKKTLIIVAHRLSTIRNCDKIFEIKGGVAITRNKDEIFHKQLV